MSNYFTDLILEEMTFQTLLKFWRWMSPVCCSSRWIIRVIYKIQNSDVQNMIFPSSYNNCKSWQQYKCFLLNLFSTKLVQNTMCTKQQHSCNTNNRAKPGISFFTVRKKENQVAQMLFPG